MEQYCTFFVNLLQVKKKASLRELNSQTHIKALSLTSLTHSWCSSADLKC